MKLTANQIAALKAIAAGEVKIRNAGAAPRIDGASPTVVGRLVRSLALARWPRGGLMDGEVCGLTDAGRAALSAATGTGEA